MITDNQPERTEVMVMFRIISRHDWDTLQSLHKSSPGSTVEHLYRGMYVLTIPGRMEASGASHGGRHE